MEASTRDRRPGRPARPLRRRHRPDHPERLAQAGRAHRLRRGPVLGVARELRLRAQPGAVRRRADPRRRAQLRHRLVTRARAVGARGLRVPGRHLAALRRHLPQQLPEDRAAAGRRCPPTSSTRIMRADRGRPVARDRRSTSSTGASRCPPSTSTSRSSSTTSTTTGCSNGLDDIGLTLRHVADIDTFEAHRPAWTPQSGGLTRRELLS